MSDTRQAMSDAQWAMSKTPFAPFIRRILCFAFLLLLAACAPSRLAVYSRPGGAEVYVDDRLVSRTINEVEATRIDLKPGMHQVRVLREGYEPWEREVEVLATREVAVLADLVAVPLPPHHVPVGAIEIRTEPSGARVFLDQKELGYSRDKSAEPIRVENLAPGKYKLRAERPGYESDQGVYEVFANQTTRAIFTLKPLTPYYLYPTNDDLVRSAVRRALVGSAFLPGMKSSKSIALVDLSGGAQDAAIRNLIEDILVAELAQNGRPVAEREDHLLVRVANEAARGDSLALDVLTRHAGPNRPFLYDARLQSAAEAVAVITPGDGPAREIQIRSSELASPAHVPTADQVLGYRLIEKTFRVDPAHEPDAKEPQLRREAIIRIYLRLVSARTGIVEWAQRFEASVADQVPERVYPYLKEPPDRFYAYGEAALPARAAGDTPLPPPTTAVVEMTKPAEADAIFWYYRHMGEAYLRADRYPEAGANLEEAARLRPDDYETRILLGEAKLRSGDLEAAGAEYRAALRAVTGLR